MRSTGSSLLLAALLALATTSGAPAQDAPAAAPPAPAGKSWAPVAPAAPAAPSAPSDKADRDQPLPKEPQFAPPDLAAPAQPPPPAAPGAAGQVCAKADFEAVVDDAAGSLRDLNLKNKPDFQEKLRQLKDKRGWSHDQFLKEAAPFVRDDKIAVFDQQSEQLLSDISTLGQEGADAATPDCALLADLKSRMQTLVDTQTAKWTYMFEKLDAALAQ